MADLTYNIDFDTTKAGQQIQFFFKDLERNATGAAGMLRAVFDQEFTTNVKLKFENGELVAKRVNSMKDDVSKIEQAWRQVNGEVGKTANELRGQLGTLKSLRDDVQKYEDGTGNISKDWQILTGKIKAAEAELKKITQETTLAERGAKALAEEFGKTPAALRAQIEVLKELLDNTQKYKTGTQETTEAWNQVSAKLDAAEARMKKFSEKAYSSQQAFIALNSELGRTPNELKKQLAVLNELKNNTAKYKEGTEKINPLWTRVTQKIKQAEKALADMNGTLQKVSSFGGGGGINALIGKFTLAQVAAGLLVKGLNAIVSGVVGIGQTGGELQILELTFTAFTGSATKASSALETFRDIASTTSFNLEQVAKAGQIMLAYGVETNQAVESTRQLSIVASATGGDITNLARNLGQVVTQGRAYTRDLTQFAIQGIPIWTELEKVTGENVVTLKEFAKDGKITFLEVQTALDNLTAKGGAFAEIADKIDSTWIGKMRKLESGVQAVALEFVKMSTKADEFLGGPIAGSLETLNNLLNATTKNMGTLVAAVIAAGAAFAAFKLTQFVASFGGLVTIVQLMANTIYTQAIPAFLSFAATVQAAMLANPALFAATVVAAGAAAVAFASFKSSADASAASVFALDQGLGDVNTTLKELEVKDGNFLTRLFDLSGASLQARIFKDELSEVVLLAKERFTEYQKEAQELENLISKVERRYDIEIDKQKRIIEGIDGEIAAEQKANDKAIAAVNKRYNEEKKQINDIYNAKLKAIDAEIAALGKRGPYEQKLYEFEKNSLERKIRSGQLSGEELLRARARLERMNRQEEIEKKQEERAKIRAEQEAALVELQKQQAGAIDALVRKLDDFIRKKEDEKEAAENAIRAQEAAKEEAVAQYKEMLDVIEDEQQAIEDTSALLEAQAEKVETLRDRYKEAREQAEKLAEAARKALSSNPNGSAGANPPKAAGGPVSGGKTYTVNELGQEAFLSAGGKLSMINAPSWGQWKAPGAGTVIPAHITSQLQIPKGGVRVSNAPSMNAGKGGNAGLLRALSSAGGDNIQNNVTIQAQNPTKAASDMLVSLTKIRRRRYS